MITFAMTGLWHGASWNFVGWGVYQGIFIILERLGLGKLLKKNDVLAVIYSDIVFAVSIILFHEISMRSTLDIWLVMFGIRQGTPLQPLALMISPLELCVFIAGILGCGVIQGIGGLKENKLSRMWKGSFLEVLFLSAAMFLSITFLSTDAYNPFIYFRF
jgi:alginate O-acetyltransferase complex protein AlgI